VAPLIRLLEPLAQDADVEIAAAAQNGAELEVSYVDAPDQIVDAARGADGIIVKFIEVSADTIAGLNGVRVIGRTGAGVDNIALDAATERGIAVINVPDYCVEEVATSAAAFVLADARRLHDAEVHVRNGRWSDAWPDLQPIVPLSQQTLGVVGLGRIGAEACRILAPLFGTTLGYDPGPPETPAGVERVELDELFRRSDVVTLHCPLTPETRHMVDRERIATMPSGATIVNVARGPLIDQVALAEALRAGTLRSASIDVTDPEPPPPGDPIFDVPNLRITNHMSWLSDASLLRNRTMLAERCAAYLTGGDPVSLVNRAVLERNGGG
jgi:D-3-phosphoglycerate dehydrogenase